MREILFRGKCVDTGTWYEGGYIHLHKTTHCPIGNPERFPDNDIHQIVFERMTDWELPNQHLRVDVAPETVGQYTGLTDKNGKKIFEGDIIRALVNETEESSKFIELGLADKKVKVPTGNKIQAFWSVEWKTFSGSAGWRVYGKDRRFNIPLTPNVIFNCQCEVIGNIHDNPELLEVSDGN